MSSLWTELSGTRYFSVLCFTIVGMSESILPVVPKNTLRLRYCTYFWMYSAIVSVTQKYFMSSGIVMRISLARLK